MIAKILSWLGSGALDKVTGHIKDAYLAKQKAQTDERKLEADLRIHQFEAQRDILIAEQRNWITRWIRPAFAFPFVVYLWKVVLWDKVLGLGSTDPLSTQLGEIMMIMIGAYFLTRPFEKFVKRWKP